MIVIISRDDWIVNRYNRKVIYDASVVGVFDSRTASIEIIKDRDHSVGRMLTHQEFLREMLPCETVSDNQEPEEELPEVNIDDPTYGLDVQ